MVVLLTPSALESSESLRHEIEYALSAKNYDGRLATVFVGSTYELPKDVPWILQKLPFHQLASLDEGIDEVVDEIASLQT